MSYVVQGVLQFPVLRWALGLQAHTTAESFSVRPAAHNNDTETYCSQFFLQEASLYLLPTTGCLAFFLHQTQQCIFTQCTKIPQGTTISIRLCWGWTQGSMRATQAPLPLPSEQHPNHQGSRALICTPALSSSLSAPSELEQLPALLTSSPLCPDKPSLHNGSINSNCRSVNLHNLSQFSQTLP